MGMLENWNDGKYWNICGNSEMVHYPWKNRSSLLKIFFEHSTVRDLPLHEAEQGLLYLGDIYTGIITGSVGTLIEDSDDRDGVGISDTTGQIQFTGNGHNGFWPHFNDNSPGQRSPRGHSDSNLMLLGKLYKVLDFAFAAPLTVLNVTRYLDVAIEILDTLGQQEEKPGGPRLMGIRVNQLVVDLDEGPLNPLPGNPHDATPKDHKGEENFDNDPPQLP